MKKIEWSTLMSLFVLKLKSNGDKTKANY
jgi:hypothetical protein